MRMEISPREPKILMQMPELIFFSVFSEPFLVSNGHIIEPFPVSSAGTYFFFFLASHAKKWPHTFFFSGWHGDD